MQGNVEQNLKNLDEENREIILKKYLRLTREAEERGAELIVWPEAAWPGRLRAREWRLAELEEIRVPMLIGASVYDWDKHGLTAFNSAFWIRAGQLKVACSGTKLSSRSLSGHQR